jgi:hypothetical protein
MTPHHFCDYLPFEEDLALYLNNLEFPLLKDNLYQVWLKVAGWFWRRRSLKIFSVFLLFCYYLPLEKGNPIHLNNLEQFRSLSPQGWFVPNLIRIGPVVLEKKVENVKVYIQTDGQTDDGQRAIRKAHLSFQLRWAKNRILLPWIFPIQLWNTSYKSITKTRYMNKWRI